MDGKGAFRKMYQESSLASSYDEVRFSTSLGKTVDAQEDYALREIFGKKRGIKVLDVACGTGRITKKLERFRGTGIDSSEEMMGISRKRVRGGRWRFKRADLFTMNLHEKFDAVVSFRFLRHLSLQDQERALKVIRRHLKKGGLFVFDALNRDRAFAGKLFEALFMAGKTIKALGRPKNVYDHYFSKKELIGFLERNGFAVLKMYPVANNYSKLSFWKLAQKALPFGFRAGAEKMDPGDGRCLQWVIVAGLKDEK